MTDEHNSYADFKSNLGTLNILVGEDRDLLIEDINSLTEDPKYTETMQALSSPKGGHLIAANNSLEAQTFDNFCDDLLRHKQVLLWMPEYILSIRFQTMLASVICGLTNYGHGEILIVSESDWILDRIRMEIKRGNCPHDEVRIFAYNQNERHCLVLDESGQLDYVPESYRRFQLEENSRYFGVTEMDTQECHENDCNKEVITRGRCYRHALDTLEREEAVQHVVEPLDEEDKEHNAE